MMAFALEGYYSGAKTDERYFRWIAEITTAQDGEYVYQQFPMQKCTQADYDKFYAPDFRSEAMFESLKASDGLFCFDWQKYGPELYRSWTISNTYISVDIQAIPCGSYLPGIDDESDRVKEECNWDRDSLIEYLGSFSLSVVYNQGTFRPDVYDDGKIR